MAQTVYRSTDASAPVLDNTNGSLVTVLDAVLVNGYGSMTPLGWTIPFTGTNKRVYQQAAGNGFQVRVDDSGNVYEAKIRGAVSFSDVDTPSADPFPTVSQAANGVFWQKTNNTSGNRVWTIWGDTKRFYLFIGVNGSTTVNGGFFGDIFPFKIGDAYHTLVIGKAATIATENSDLLGALSTTNDLFGSSMTGHYLARSHTQVGSAVPALKYSDGSRHSGQAVGVGGVGSTPAYPDPVSGAIHLARVFVAEPNPVYGIRGYLPGFWDICHDRLSMAGIANGDSFSGSGGLGSKTFEVQYLRTQSQEGAVAMESSAWAE